jgi:hypothetical protein
VRAIAALTALSTHVALTRTQKSESIIITGDFDFSVFSTGQPLNFRNELLLAKLGGNTQEYEALSSRRLQCRNSQVFKPDVAVVRIFVSDIDMEDGDDAGSHVPAVDDLSNDETEGSGSSEESDVFDVRRREDEPWSESASSSEDGHDDDGGGGIEAANEALLTELDADVVTASETSSSPFRRFEKETAKVVNMLRRNPLLPEGVSADAAVRASGVCCGFAGCDAVGPSAEWVVDHPGKLPRDWLAQHIHYAHLEDLRGRFDAAERCVSANPTSSDSDPCATD